MRCTLYNVRMSRLIAFVFCLTVLFLAGGWVKSGLVLLAVVAVLLVAYIAALAISVFIRPVQRPSARL